MIRHFFITFSRNLKRHPGYSAVNTLGLAIGITCAWIIFQYIRFENSYDSFHPDSTKIYQIISSFGGPNSSEEDLTVTPFPLGKSLAESFPKIDRETSTISYFRAKTWPRGETELAKYDSEFLFVDEAFFDVFDFPLIRGEPENLFEGPNILFISQQKAKSYFGNGDPLGREIAIQFSDSIHYFVVSGILKDFPDNTQFVADFVLSHQGYKKLNGADELESWSSFSTESFFVFEDIPIISEFELKITEVYYSKRKREGLSHDTQFSLLPLTSLHLHESFGQAKKSRLLTFALIGWVLLLVACINYMNLATARASVREQEIGIRQTLGANRKQLISQFLGESLIFSMIAALLAIAFIDLSIPYISNLVQKRFAVHTWSQPLSWLLILCLGIGTGLLSGIYPAFILSGKRNVSRHFVQRKEKGYLRKALVGVQFLVASVLIIAVLVIQKQIFFMQHQDLGFDKEQVIYVEIPKSARKNHQILKSSFLAIPEVLSVSSCNFTLDGRVGTIPSITPGNSYGEASVSYALVDESFGKTLNLRLLGGRWPRPHKFGMWAQDPEVVVNESFQKKYGLDNPIGQPFSKENPNSKIVGIVKDFHYNSLKYGINPMIIFGLKSWSVRHIALKLQGGDIPETLQKLETVWNEETISEPFTYSFLEDRIDRLYKEERTFASLIRIFSGLAILIGCMGLFALVAFSAESRSKEIGIRKVLGARVRDILAILNRSFFLLIGGSFLIAIPLTIWLMQHWLSEFAYRIQLQPDSFLWAGGILMGVTFLTVSYYSLRAALADPVLALKDE